MTQQNLSSQYFTTKSSLLRMED